MLFIIIALLLVNCIVGACEEDWFEYGTSCYHMPENGPLKAYEDARNFCLVKKARLPTFHSLNDYLAYRINVTKWGTNEWLGYWFDRSRKLLTFTGYPSGKLCDWDEDDSTIDKHGFERRNDDCIISFTLSATIPRKLVPSHENCNEYYRFACQKPNKHDDCPEIATTTTTIPETQTSPTPNTTTELETSAMSTVTTEIQTTTISNTQIEIQTSTISNAYIENETLTYNYKKILYNPLETNEMKSTTKSHGKMLAKPKDSSSKGKQTIVYIIVVICVIGFLVVIIVVVVLVRRRTRKKAAEGAITSKLSKKSYPIFSTSSVSEATKVKSQHKTHQKSFIGSLRKSMHKSQRNSKVNSLQKTQQNAQLKSQQKTLPKTHLNPQPPLLQNFQEHNKKGSVPYADFDEIKPAKNPNKGRKSNSVRMKIPDLANTSLSADAEEESDYETVKP